jgi:hypothetical protein
MLMMRIEPTGGPGRSTPEDAISDAAPETSLADPSTRPAVRRAFVLLGALLVVVHVAIAWAARAPGVLTGQDDAEYIALGRSIREGGYNDLFRIDHPVHRTYPPAYPALLAAWGVVAGDPFDRLVALNVLISGASLFLLLVAVRRVSGPTLALLCATLVAINPVLIEFAGEVRSEPAYIFFTLMSLWLLLRGEGAIRWLAGGVAVALLAAATRVVGATLLIAIFGTWVLERRWRLVGGLAAVAVLAVTAWLLWTSRSHDQFIGVSYLAEMRALLRGTRPDSSLLTRMVRSARYYATITVPWYLAIPTVHRTIIDNAIGGLVIWSSIAGGAVALFTKWRPAMLYLGAYALLLLAWVFTVDRFVLPIVPLLIVCSITGAARLGRRVGRRTAVALPAALACILALGAMPRTAALVRRNSPCHVAGAYPPAACMTEAQASYFDALRWIDANLPAGAVLLTSKSGALWLYTGRHVVSYDAAIRQDSAAFIPWLQERGAGWILLNKLHNREPSYLVPLLRANCHSLTVVAEFPPGSTLFAIGGPPPDEGLAACRIIDEYHVTAAQLDVEGRVPDEAPAIRRP